MTNCTRRGALKRAAGATLAASGLYATSGVADADEGEGRGDQSNEFDGTALEQVWEFDRSYTPVSLVDGTVYTGTGSSVYDEDGMAALDAEDGSIRWETDVVFDEPLVVDDALYQTSRGTLYALDRADGNLRWRAEFETDAGLSTPAVGDGVVCVSTHETLYALEIDDGSVRWHVDIGPHDGTRAPEPTVGHGAVYAVAAGELSAFAVDDGSLRWRVGADESGDFGAVPGPIATADRVYAASETVRAFDPATGDERWSVPRDGVVSLDVSSTALAVTDYSTIEIYDLESREKIASVPWRAFVTDRFALGDEIAIARRDDPEAVVAIDLETGDELWQVPSTYGNPVIADDTVYFHGAEAVDAPHEVVAVDASDGTETWSAESGSATRDANLVVGDRTVLVETQGRIRALRDPSDDTADESGDDGDEETDSDGATGDGTGGDSETTADGGTNDPDASEESTEADDAGSDAGADPDAGENESDGSDADDADETPGFGVIGGLVAAAGGAAIAARRFVSPADGETAANR